MTVLKGYEKDKGQVILFLLRLDYQEVYCTYINHQEQHKKFF